MYFAQLKKTKQGNYAHFLKITFCSLISDNLNAIFYNKFLKLHSTICDTLQIVVSKAVQNYIVPNDKPQRSCIMPHHVTLKLEDDL